MKKEINSNKKVTVFGAYGHTGKFVVAELLKRGLIPILSGRSENKLKDMCIKYPSLEMRLASIDDPNSIDNALKDSIAVINCAGPFLDTAIPIIESALRKSVHYLDVTAEQKCVIDIYEKFSEQALNKEIVIIPAIAFFGGLADLLATSAMGDWTKANIIDIAIALDSWMPTIGTRLTGKRNINKRLTFSKNKLEFISDPLPTRKWEFSKPFGSQDVIAFPLTEIITISKHLLVNEINTYINLTPINDIHNSETPPPIATDESGRSSQTFLMEVEVSFENKLRKAKASGRDIYAITAPLIVEATLRIIEGINKKTGIVSVGEIFDSIDFLKSLSPEYLSIS
jgi:short subunit dehydrogenase-like uncharacterized protein